LLEEDFGLVKVELPELKKEDEFLVRNIWMSVDPFMRIYMVKGNKIRPPVVTQCTTDDLLCGRPEYIATILNTYQW
jgi:NADPH-dependent curcumin reductase CurA